MNQSIPPSPETRELFLTYPLLMDLQKLVFSSTNLHKKLGERIAAIKAVILPEGWRPMSEYTRGEVLVKLPDGTETIGHWASDLSGDEQPPFEGWFETVYVPAMKAGDPPQVSYCRGIDTPIAWKEKAHAYTTG